VQQLIEFAGNNLGLFAGFTALVLLLIWTEISRRTRGYQELTPALAVQRINRNDAKIIDVSAAADFAKGHVSGAKHIALSKFNQKAPEVEALTESPLLIVCKNGQTAHQAAAQLVKLGAKDVAVLKGGITQWKADQYPLATK
jgi:rhodanese-related sulfurtransferase